MLIRDTINAREVEITPGDLLRWIVDDSVGYGEGSVEALRSKVDKLTEILAVVITPSAGGGVERHR